MARQLAHEIKNPLGGLRSAAQLLERELPSAELKEYARAALARVQGRRQEAAKLIGWGRNTLTRKLRELGID